MENLFAREINSELAGNNNHVSQPEYGRLANGNRVPQPIPRGHEQLSDLPSAGRKYVLASLARKFLEPQRGPARHTMQKRVLAEIISRIPASSGRLPDFPFHFSVGDLQSLQTPVSAR
jgi:hypothetical protein